jgi:hypothetical protein
MCCCCGDHGERWGRHGHRHEHGHGYGYEHGHGHQHGHGHGHGDEPGRDEECGPRDDGPRGYEARDERRGPPGRDRGGEGGGDGREGGREGEGFNWNEQYPFGFRRHFHSRDEEIEFLRRYLDGLEKEAAAVREIIALAKDPPGGPSPPAPPAEPAGSPPADGA